MVLYCRIYHRMVSCTYQPNSTLPIFNLVTSSLTQLPLHSHINYSLCIHTDSTFTQPLMLFTLTDSDSMYSHSSLKHNLGLPWSWFLMFTWLYLAYLIIYIAVYKKRRSCVWRQWMIPIAFWIVTSIGCVIFLIWLVTNSQRGVAQISKNISLITPPSTQ